MTVCASCATSASHATASEGERTGTVLASEGAKSRTVDAGSISIPDVVNTDSISLSSGSYRTRSGSSGSA